MTTFNIVVPNWGIILFIAYCCFSTVLTTIQIVQKKELIELNKKKTELMEKKQELRGF